MKYKILSTCFFVLCFSGLYCAGADSNFRYSIKKFSWEQKAREGKDTTVALDYFLSYDVAIEETFQFNYPRMSKKVKSGDSLLLKNDSITLVIAEQPFDSLQNELTYYRDENNVLQPWVSHINGKQFYGSDGPVPATQFAEISIWNDGKKWTMDRREYADLFNGRLTTRSANLYVAGPEHFIFSFWGSDGAGGYNALFFIKKRKVIFRSIWMP